jgi:hypothetical protein
MPSRLLLAPARAEAKRQHPGLDARLIRATPIDARTPGIWAQLAPELGLDADGSGAAAVMLAADPAIELRTLAESRFVCLTPTWARAEVNGARLLALAESLGPSPTEQQAIDQAVAEVAHDFGLIPTNHASLWQLPATAAPGAGLAPPDHALGTDLREALTLSGWWLKLFTEFQVALHVLPANAVRVARGLPPVNTVWLHGAGGLPEVRRHWASLHSSDPLLLGLARLSGMARAPITKAALIDARHEGLADALAGFRGTLRCVSGEAWTLSRLDAFRIWRRPARR